MWNFERTRDFYLGPAGNEVTHLVMTGNLVFLFELLRDMWGFSPVMMRNSGSLSCGPREVLSPFVLRGRARHCSRVMAGESGSRLIERSISRSFSSCNRKPWVPLACDRDLRELFRVPMGSQDYCGVGRSHSVLHWLWCNGRGPQL